MAQPVSFRSIAANKARAVVESGLQNAASGIEALHNAINPAPPNLANEDTVDGVYNSSIARLIEDIKQQIEVGSPVTLSLQNAAAIVDALVVSKFDGGLDDRLLLLEQVLEFLSRLPQESTISKTLQDQVIALLWHDLPHPPASLIGRKYQYRSADGYGTSLWNPAMGKAGSAYARSVQSLHPLPANKLPSPELLFDTLLKREAQVNHPAGLSSLFFALANIIIHCLFFTDHTTSEPINQTSSYVDLSPLYGNSQKEQDSIRLFDGTGRICPDTFADSRLLRMPPSTPALLVIFSRNHNYIVKTLLEINERGIWSNPPPTDHVQRELQDEDLFQTARLVNCGWFKSMILGDYLAGILGMVREGNSWSLDPLSAIRTQSHELVERGSGNVVSIEFSALYHWHSIISAKDEKWAEQMFRSPELFGNTPWDDITIQDYEEKIRQAAEYAAKNPRPPNTWTFGNMQRDSTGKFPDVELARILQDATSEPASAFKARGIPHAMRIIEIMAIQQNRDWGTCSLNEFRKFLGLRPYSTFEEWNPRPDITEGARRLYQHPDNLELYVGLQAEESKVPGPGAGLCPGFTISRAILADAIALVRGDRFLTNDFTPFNLTAWGFNDCQRNTKNSANGGVLCSLLLRHLPDQYSPNSSYTIFPLVTPEAINLFFQRKGIAQNYSFERPVMQRPVRAITNYGAAEAALGHPDVMSDVPRDAMDVLPGRGYFASLNMPKEHREDQNLILHTFTDPSFVTEQVAFLENLTSNLIKERSYNLVGAANRSVNVVREVLNMASVHFASAFVMGLPLKTPENPSGTILDQELYLKLSEVHDYLFLNSGLDTKLARKPVIREYCADLASIVQAQLGVAGRGASSIQAHRWLYRLLQSGKDRVELANDAVALGVLCVMELSQSLTHVVDAFLDPPMLATIMPLVQSNRSYSVIQLMQRVERSLLIRPPIPGVYRRVAKDVGGFVAGDRIYISYTDIALELAREPAAASSSKPLFAGELVQLLGTDWLLTVMVPVIRALFNLRDIRRAAGNSGKLLSIFQDVEGTKARMYLDYKEVATPWSSDLTVNYTGTR
ncbi:hypothetical protein FRB95_002930 [Tulasnella sp. JGI-2019a]|nr:hypothetical protein FRB95_002930 [Tulasnella sp. JGI-2019a]